MNKNLVREIEGRQLRTDYPDFASGDTVRVHVRIIENKRERLQAFEGVVLQRRGGGISETFTVRKVTGGVGIERNFNLHSPSIHHIELLKVGRVRRAKIYYLRTRYGKKARIKEKL